MKTLNVTRTTRAAHSGTQAEPGTRSRDAGSRLTARHSHVVSAPPTPEPSERQIYRARGEGGGRWPPEQIRLVGSGDPEGGTGLGIFFMFDFVVQFRHGMVFKSLGARSRIRLSFLFVNL